MLSTDLHEATGALSDLKNPFDSSMMTDFDIFCSKDRIFNKGNWNYTGHISFKNGDTRGKQDFKADSLQSLLVKMEAFVKELEKKK